MSNRLKAVVVSALVAWGAVLLPMFIVPQTAYAANENCTKNSSVFLGMPTWYKYLDFDEGSDECNIEFDPKEDAGKVLLAVFEILLRVAGLIAIGFVIFGGFQYIISQGEPDRISGARTTIINALVGLAIAVSATAIVNLVAQNI